MPAFVEKEKTGKDQDGMSFRDFAWLTLQPYPGYIYIYIIETYL